VSEPGTWEEGKTDRWKHADLKATALLKLIYLEMFGHDMSWASFHVLEVMSSAKYLQKRVGYLGAVQSFRQDTEVLMLATNLLKKVQDLWKIPRTNAKLA
jgi:AP-3 complex subunit delta-1